MDLNKREFLKKGLWSSLGLVGAFSLSQKLANAGIWFNDNSNQTSASSGGGTGITWQAVKTADFTAVAAQGYFVDTTSSEITVTLPASPSQGDRVYIVDHKLNFGTNRVTIFHNGNNIRGLAEDIQLNRNKQSIKLVYCDTTQGWLVENFNPSITIDLRYQMVSYAALFDGSTGYLSRTPSAGNLTTWTLNFWIFSTGIGKGYQRPIGTTATGGWIQHSVNNSNDKWEWMENNQTDYIRPKYEFRDSTAFFMITMVWDTTNSTSTDRMRIYKNGIRITDFDNSVMPDPSASSTYNSTIAHYFGRQDGGTPYYWKGYMSEVNFIDGQALTPSDFGETEPMTGNWIAKQYAGTYGTNGFYLDFSDNTNLGKDMSGNGNDWTVTGGVTQVTSTPTNTYATMSPLHPSSTYLIGTGALSNGNLSMTSGSGRGHACDIPFTYKTYWEVKFETLDTGTDYPRVGLYNTSSTVYNDVNGESIGADGINCRPATSGQWLRNDSSVGTYSTFSSGDILMMAFDPTTGKFWAGKNGTWFNSGDPAAGTGEINTLLTTVKYAFSASTYSTSACTVNFGNPVFSITSGNSDENGKGNFEYSVPAGFKALCTDNLPEINDSIDNHFKTITWSGDAVEDRTITTGLSDVNFVWIKNRTTTYNNVWFDTIRGATKSLFSGGNGTNAEETTTTHGYLSAFNGDGTFDLHSNASNYGNVNASGNNYVAWCAKLPSSSSGSTTGSGTSKTYSEIYNVTLGMSIITYTGNGTGGHQIPHSLGKVPGMVIVKRTDGGTNSWMTYHSGRGATDYGFLDNTNTFATHTTAWNDTEPTTSVFTLGSTSDVNGLDNTYVAYIFAQTDFCKIGSYTANGSTSSDGPFVNLGGKPDFLLLKNTSGVDPWGIFDSIRNPYNVCDESLLPNSDAGTTTGGGYLIDFTANGFKLRTTIAAPFNSGSDTEIYLAFVQPNSPKENPAK